jgi:hypothetical protein
VLAKRSQHLIRLTMVAARYPQFFQQPPDILPKRPHLALLIAFRPAQMLSCPFLDTLQLRPCLLPLNFARSPVLDHGLALSPERRHLSRRLGIIHPEVALVLDYGITKSPVRQFGPVYRLRRRLQQQHRHARNRLVIPQHSFVSAEYKSPPL